MRMRFKPFAGAALALSLAVFAAPALAADPAPKPAAADGSDQPASVKVPGADTSVELASKEAIRTLPIFWKLYDAPPDGAENFQINVGFPTPAGPKEYIWLVILSRSDAGVTGRIDNPVETAQGIKYGDVVTVKYADIFDWGYNKDGLFWGNYTTRAMLKFAPPDVQDQFKTLMSPTPLEPGLH